MIAIIQENTLGTLCNQVSFEILKAHVLIGVVRSLVKKFSAQPAR